MGKCESKPKLIFHLFASYEDQLPPKYSRKRLEAIWSLPDQAWGNLPPDNTNSGQWRNIRNLKSHRWLQWEKEHIPMGTSSYIIWGSQCNMKTGDPLFRTVRTSRWRQQTIKATTGPFWEQLLACTGDTPTPAGSPVLHVSFLWNVTPWVSTVFISL